MYVIHRYLNGTIAYMGLSKLAKAMLPRPPFHQGTQFKKTFFIVVMLFPGVSVECFFKIFAYYCLNPF